MNPRLHHKTPTINAVDGRGLPVRQVAYYRRDAQEPAQARIAQQDYDVAGRQVAQRDPRLFAKATGGSNLQTVYSLSGKPLLLDSIDAGWRLFLPGDAGQILHSWDQRGTYWRTTYDTQLRMTAVHEQAANDVPRKVECLQYGDSSPKSAVRNRCGALIRHDDSAGTLLIHDYGLCAKPLSQTRHLLAVTERPDWPEDEKDRDRLLEPGDGYTTSWSYDALAELIQQTDAAQHQQRYAFDVAGQLKSMGLLIRNTATEKVIVSDLVYNASGQIESQTAGNGVVSRAVYDPANGRLTALRTSLAARTLQDLHYTCDPVGNVTHLEDKAQPVQFGNNQRVDASSTFTYDSLYQLISATGREAAGLTRPPDLPALGKLPIDPGQLFNFTEHYEYDAGGNLIELRHRRDGNHYTRTLDVAAASNRLRAWNKGHSTPDMAVDFDANGNQQALAPGQALTWNLRNQLDSVVLVRRENASDDIERYRYDSGGQRVRKIQTTQGATRVHTREVRYLPGLEIRTRDNERVEVITLQAGRCGVRYLHWTQGRPSAIAANPLRYSFSDHLGSSALELDDQGDLISQESYLPYGATAWAASRSAVEADYRTLRYSGKERDASGLYYYGQRYYAPWLQRWISPDPAGAVDGLNLYCMVGNSPVRFADAQGLNKEESLQHLDLAELRIDRMRGYEEGMTRDQFIESAQKKLSFVKKHYDNFQIETQRLIRQANKNGTKRQTELRQREDKKANSKKLKPIRAFDPFYTSAVLTKWTAFSGIANKNHTYPLTGFHNLEGSLSPKTLFPGITLNESSGGEDTYRVSDIPMFIAWIKHTYRNSGMKLHSFFSKQIIRHVSRHQEIPVSAGVAGLHSEVVAANVWLLGGLRTNPHQRLSEAFIYTARMQKRDRGKDFPACFNCSHILPPVVNVVTGRKYKS